VIIMAHGIRVNEAAKLLARLVRSNCNFAFALNDWSHSDHRIGEVEQAVQQNPRLNGSDEGEQAIRRAERNAERKLEVVEEVMADTDWTRENRAAMQACLDAGIRVTNDLHGPGHMLRTIRELQGLRGHYGNPKSANPEFIDRNCERLVSEVADMGIDTTGYLPTVRA
jgi:hypothetical protein